MTEIIDRRTDRNKNRQCIIEAASEPIAHWCASPRYTSLYTLLRGKRYGASTPLPKAFGIRVFPNQVRDRLYTAVRKLISTIALFTPETRYPIAIGYRVRDTLPLFAKPLAHLGNRSPIIDYTMRITIIRLFSPDTLCTGQAVQSFPLADG